MLVFSRQMVTMVTIVCFYANICYLAWNTSEADGSLALQEFGYKY